MARRKIPLCQPDQHCWFEGIASKWCLTCGASAATERFERKYQQRTVVFAGQHDPRLCSQCSEDEYR